MSYVDDLIKSYEADKAELNEEIAELRKPRCLKCGGPLQERLLFNVVREDHDDNAHEDCWEGFWCQACNLHWSAVEAGIEDLCPRIEVAA